MPKIKQTPVDKRRYSRLHVPLSVFEAVEILSTNTGKAGDEIVDLALSAFYGEAYTKPRDLRNQLDELRGD